MRPPCDKYGGRYTGRGFFGFMAGPTPVSLGGAIGYGLGSGAIGGLVGGAIKAAEGGW